MALETTYTIASVILVSLVSFVGAFLLSFKKSFLNKILLLLVSFAVGALLGDAFIHLLPEAIEQTEPSSFGLYTLVGLLIFFSIEKFLRWQHRHIFHHKNDHEEGHPIVKPYVWINLFGDGIHNFIDGMIIAGSYLVSVPLGIATTLAVIFHEGAQEIGDFAVLIKGGLSRGKALFFNFLSAVAAVAGGIIALVIGTGTERFIVFLIPFTFAGFLYLALATLMPELHHEDKPAQLVVQILGIALGIGIMALLLLLE